MLSIRSDPQLWHQAGRRPFSHSGAPNEIVFGQLALMCSTSKIVKKHGPERLAVAPDIPFHVSFPQPTSANHTGSGYCAAMRPARQLGQCSNLRNLSTTAAREAVYRATHRAGAEMTAPRSGYGRAASSRMLLSRILTSTSRLRASRYALLASR